jgi:hypothetical protein
MTAMQDQLDEITANTHGFTRTAPAISGFE